MPKKARTRAPAQRGKARPKQRKSGSAIRRIAPKLLRLIPGIGGTAASIFKALTGSGDYTLDAKSLGYDVTQNSIISPTLAPSVPLMHNDNGSTRVRHREFISTVLTEKGNLVSNAIFSVNPGDSRTFPWLHSLARHYQQYKVMGCVFEIVSTCGNAVSSTNSALGSVTMATQYNVNNPYFSSLQVALNSYFSTSEKPSVNQMHALECNPIESPYNLWNTRQKDISDSKLIGDHRLYDFARLEVLSTGSQAQFEAGQLWVTYDILLLKPINRESGFNIVNRLISYNIGHQTLDPELVQDAGDIKEQLVDDINDLNGNL